MIIYIVMLQIIGTYSTFMNPSKGDIWFFTEHVYPLAGDTVTLNCHVIDFFPHPIQVGIFENNRPLDITVKKLELRKSLKWKVTFSTKIVGYKKYADYTCGVKYNTAIWSGIEYKFKSLDWHPRDITIHNGKEFVFDTTVELPADGSLNEYSGYTIEQPQL